MTNFAANTFHDQLRRNLFLINSSRLYVQTRVKPINLYHFDGRINIRVSYVMAVWHRHNDCDIEPHDVRMQLCVASIVPVIRIRYKRLMHFDLFDPFNCLLISCSNTSFIQCVRQIRSDESYRINDAWWSVCAPSPFGPFATLGRIWFVRELERWRRVTQSTKDILC